MVINNATRNIDAQSIGSYFQLPLQLLALSSQGQPLQQMLTENPVMAAAMQQVLTLPTSTASPGPGPGPGFPGLPSSADLMQQAQALQFLAQLQSMFLMNPMMSGQNPSQARSQESQVNILLCSLWYKNIWHNSSL